MTWGESSALAPAGPQAARLAGVTWTFIAVCAVVYVAVMVALLTALVRRGRDAPGEASGEAPDEKARLRVVAAAGGLTTLILLGLLIVSVRAGHGLNPMRGAHDTLTVRVTARQWWWEFQYPGDAPNQRVTTANELHIPTGRPLLLELVSRDVIHSFWVPALHGKRDLIPGHDSTTYIQADRPGVFRGQCAEFCGAQHAKMGFVVLAQPESEFQAWLDQQRRPATAADAIASAPVRHGHDLFVGGTCPMCHTVVGTIAGATMGPDLTHIASRTTLAAGSVPNVRDHLARWIADAQAIKPGSRMPPTPLASEDLNDLLDYLETLR
jgi:cytochrome c oxidase subunit II